MTRIRGFVVVLLVVSLPLVAGVGLGAAAGASSGTHDYTLTELQDGGTHTAGAPPSLRWLGRSSSVYVDYPNTNPLLGGSSGKSYQVANLLEPGATVRPDRLRLHYQGPRTGGERTLTLHVVYWEKGTTTRVVNGTETSEAVPVNVTEQTKEVTFENAFASKSVALKHVDDAKRVTMWVDGHEGARWTFRHASTATSATVPATTAGGRLWWLITNFAVWLVGFVAIGAGVVLWAHKRAGRGTGIGIAGWSFIGLLVTGGALLWNYQGLASLVVNAPPVLAFLVAFIPTVILLEGQDDRIRKLLLAQPVVTEATSASGEEAVDVLRMRLKEIDVTELADGTLSVVKPGPVKFLARLFGGAAPLQGAPDMEKTRVSADGDTRHEQVVWVDHEADGPLSVYEPEGFRTTFPDSWGGRAVLGLVMAVVGAGAWTMFGPTFGVLAGLGAAFPFVVTARMGAAKVEPANAHQRSAHVSAMVLAKDLDDAATVDAALSELYRERARTSRKKEEVIDIHDESLMEETLGLDLGREDDTPAVTDGGQEDDDE